MKQGKIYNKIIMAALFCAIVGYMGFSLFSSLRATFQTSPIMEYEAGEGYAVTGYVVRDEEVLTSSWPITIPTMDEGSRVASRQMIAMGYKTADSQQNQSQINALTSQLAQLEYANAYSNDANDTVSLDKEIMSEVLNFSQSAAQNDFESANDTAALLKGLVLSRTATEEDIVAIEGRKKQLQAELADLRALPSGRGVAINSPKSGRFSNIADGYESVLTPESIFSMTAEDLQDVEPTTPSTDAFGRLISGDSWYFVATIPSAFLEEFELGDTVQLSFSSDIYDMIPMEISRIGEDENGERLLILESNKKLHEVALFREQKAHILFDSYSGLRVPKSALRMDENNTPGVFIVENAKAKWKPVAILYDNGESYVVELDKSSTDNLWPGDELIIEAQDIYDGKVVS